MAESNYNPPAHCWFALFVICVHCEQSAPCDPAFLRL